jgi:hypothetical protein
VKENEDSCKIFGNIFIIFQHQNLQNQLIIWGRKKSVEEAAPVLHNIYIPAKHMFALRGRPWLMTRV